MPKIRIRLSENSIQQAREQIQGTKDWIHSKMREFVQQLAERGIQVAESNTGVWGKYLQFVVETEETETNCKAILIMRDASKIVNPHDGRPVSPSLMAEYGAGKFAIDGDVKGLKVGRGTFPEQKHAFDPLGWWYLGKDDKWHHSYGTKPTRPMYTAYTDMIQHIEETAKRVFV